MGKNQMKLAEASRGTPPQNRYDGSIKIKEATVRGIAVSPGKVENLRKKAREERDRPIFAPKLYTVTK